MTQIRKLSANMNHDDQIKERLKDLAKVMESSGLNEVESLMLAQILNHLVLLWSVEGLDVKTKVESELHIKLPGV